MASVAMNARTPPQTQASTAQAHSAQHPPFTVQIEEGGDGRVTFAVASCQGFRSGMEDAHAVILNLEAGDSSHGGGGNDNSTALFGVFDGHAGKEVAAFCAQHLPAQVLRSPSFAASQGNGSKGLRAALHDGFLSLDDLLKDRAHQAELYAMRKNVPVPPTPEPAEAAQQAAAAAGTIQGHAGSHDASRMGAHRPAAAHAASPGPILHNPVVRPDNAPAGVDAAGSDAYSAARRKEVQAALPHHIKQQAADYGKFSADSGQYLGPKAGSTAVVALLRQGHLVVGHVGDSRCVLSRGGVAQSMTHDHKPDQPQERARIYAAGEIVASHRPGAPQRVGGTLAMSRAIGDVKYKANFDKGPEEQAVVAVPDTKEARITSEHDFMVLACDGVWDVMTADDVVQLVREQLQAGGTPGGVTHSIVTACLSTRNSRKQASSDNLTFMLVVFSNELKD